MSRQSLLPILLLCLTLFVGVGKMWGMSNDYNVGDQVTTLANNDLVVWGTDNATLATGSISSNWLSLSSTKSDWLIFKVVKDNNNNFYLQKVENSTTYYIYSSAKKKIEWSSDSNNRTAITLGDTDHEVLADGIGGYYYNNSGSGGIRPYETIGEMSNTFLYYAIVAKTLQSITVKTAPTKTSYVAGESFDPAGLVITEHYDDNSTTDVAYTGNENKFSFSPATNAALTTSNTAVTITYGGKTVNQAINVYSVTISMVGEDELTVLTGEGIPSAPTRTGASISVDNSTLYGFKEWKIENASLDKNKSTQNNTITNPTGNVTLKAVYNAPRTVTWMVNGKVYTPGDNGGTNGTAAVQHGKAWKTLTLPTDPTPTCGNKFMGWTTVNIGSNAYDGEISELDLMDSSNKSSKTGGGHNINNNITFYAVFADYAE